jgi:hypothetical protein
MPARDAGSCASAGPAASGMCSVLASPKSRIFTRPVGRDEQVLRLQIPVHDAARVRGGQALGDLDGVVDRTRERNGAGIDYRAQRPPLQQFRDEIGRVVLAPHVIDGEDVGVIQRGRGARLGLEPAQPLRIVGDVRRQDLDGHVAPEPAVVRAIDLPHATRAEGGTEHVRPEAGAGAGRHGQGLWPEYTGVGGPRGRPALQSPRCLGDRLSRHATDRRPDVTRPPAWPGPSRIRTGTGSNTTRGRSGTGDPVRPRSGSRRPPSTAAGGTAASTNRPPGPGGSSAPASSR